MALAVLIKQLQTKTLKHNILENLYNIAKCCDEKDYRKAGDWYIRVAIGNAPWPIGVTKTSLHMRAADDKITEDKQKSIMKDAEAAAYVMGIKRLITQAQLVRPNPSKAYIN